MSHHWHTSQHLYHLDKHPHQSSVALDEDTHFDFSRVDFDFAEEARRNYKRVFWVLAKRIGYEGSDLTIWALGEKKKVLGNTVSSGTGVFREGKRQTKLTTSDKKA
jgi:hypothetical protein